VLVPAFRAVAACDVLVLAGRHAGAAGRAARAAGIPFASGDWRTVVRRADLDAVAIAVPPAAQPAIAIAAMRAGKHVVCEKPAAAGLRQAARMAAVAAETQRATAIDFEFPEMEAFAAARRALDARRIGSLTSAAVTWRVCTRAHAMGRHPWKLDSTRGGGTLHGFGAHVLHYVEWLMGPIASVEARLRPTRRRDDVVGLWLTMESGAHVSVDIAAAAVGGSGHTIELSGRTGSVVIHNAGPDYGQFEASLRRPGRIVPLAAPSADASDGRVKATARIVKRFVAAAFGGAACRPGLDDALRVQQLIEACVESSHCGRCVKVVRRARS
jgi:predicted dehydrogenase